MSGLVSSVRKRVAETDLFVLPSQLAMFSVCIPFSGFLAIGLLPSTTDKWTLWALYQLQFSFTFVRRFPLPFLLFFLFSLTSGFPSPQPTFMMWILIPQNVAGRTKKSIVTAMTFV